MECIYEYLYWLVPRLKFLKKAKGKNYLDFGCGDGTVLRQNLAARSDLNCFGIDVKDFNEKLPKEVAFKIYDGVNIPFYNDTFDIITANHVLEHIPEPNGILLELRRVLKPDGQLFIEVPNERSLYGKPSSKYAGTIHFKDDPTHIRPYSKADLVSLFEKLDFKIVKTGISRNLLHLVLAPFLVVAGFLMPRKLYYMYARNSAIGWASYIIVTK